MTTLWRTVENRFLRRDTGDPVKDQLTHFLCTATLGLAALLFLLFGMQFVGFGTVLGGLRGAVFPVSFLIVYLVLRRGHLQWVGMLIVASVLGLMYSRPPLIVAGLILTYAILLTGLTISPRAMFATAAIAPVVLFHASIVLAGDNFLYPLTVGFTTFHPEWFDVEGAEPGLFLPTFGGTIVMGFLFASTAFYFLGQVRNAAAAKARYEATHEANKELERLNLELEHLATHDSLTNLTNRSAFIVSLEAAVTRCRSNQEHLALMFVDLDGFKAVNDNGGHDTGDELLQHVALRLNETLEDLPVEIARLGGDEFVILVAGNPDEATATGMGRVILKALARPFAARSKEIRIGCSVGLALFPDHALSAGSLLRRADHAMYAAKRLGRSRLEVASPTSAQE